MSFKLNPLLNADSYKFSHINMGHGDITEGYSNFTPRTVKHLNVPEKYKTNEIVWVGGQAVIQDMVDLWDENFFALDDSKYIFARWDGELDTFIKEFSRIIAPFAGVDYRTDHLYELHALGYLPLEIKTLPEGSRVPVGVPVLTIRNTHEKFGWLTNFIESYLSAELWKMSTAATIADYYRKIGTFWYDKTGANQAMLDFAFHNFSYRGNSGTMDAIKVDVGHLLSFKGTDTVPSIPYIEYHYSGKGTFLAASVPASEHSLQTAFEEDDEAYFREMIKRYPTGILSLVCDGYDYWGVLKYVLPKIKGLIMERQPDAMGFNKVVIRPDSGDPVRIIAGYRYGIYNSKSDVMSDLHGVSDAGYEYVFTQDDGKFYPVAKGDNHFAVSPFADDEITIEEVKGSIQVLWELFGGTINEKGYKTLNQHIGLIYGDSITHDRAEEILSRLEEKGFSADNVVFGIGSYTYSYVTRDTLGFAMKMTNIIKDGKSIPLFKDPKTGDGMKKSAKGLLCVMSEVDIENDTEKYVLINNVDREMEENSLLTTLFKDGQFLKHETFEEIRNRLGDE